MLEPDGRISWHVDDVDLAGGIPLVEDGMILYVDRDQRLVAREAPVSGLADAPQASVIGDAHGNRGLRLGELRALHWDEVDLVAARLHVRRAADDANAIDATKSYRARVVDLPKRAVAILREHKHLRGAFVFCRDDGSMLPRHACESKSKQQRDDSPLMKVCRKAALRRIGWHGLRHTYASHLAMRGASMMEIKELLGHSSITMTMRYAHLSPSARKAAVGLLDEPRGGDTGGYTGEVKR